MPIIIEQTRYKPQPAGEYPAKITKIEESNKYEDNPQLQFWFELPPNELGENRTTCGWANQKFSPKSKLYAWSEAAIGPIDRSYRFNSDDLIGKKVSITLAVEKREDGSEKNTIVDVSPFNQQSTQPTPSREIAGDW